MSEEPTPLEEAKIATRNDSAGHWPTVAAVLLEEVERLERQVREAKAAFYADGSDRAAATKMLEILSANDKSDSR